jgi:hypothetical protein
MSASAVADKGTSERQKRSESTRIEHKSNLARVLRNLDLTTLSATRARGVLQTFPNGRPSLSTAPLLHAR